MVLHRHVYRAYPYIFVGYILFLTYFIYSYVPLTRFQSFSLSNYAYLELHFFSSCIFHLFVYMPLLSIFLTTNLQQFTILQLSIQFLFGISFLFLSCILVLYTRQCFHPPSGTNVQITGTISCPSTNLSRGAVGSNMSLGLSLCCLLYTSTHTHTLENGNYCCE